MRFIRQLMCAVCYDGLPSLILRSRVVHEPSRFTESNPLKASSMPWKNQLDLAGRNEALDMKQESTILVWDLGLQPWRFDVPGVDALGMGVIELLA